MSFVPRIGRLDEDRSAVLVLALAALAVRLPIGLGPLYGEWDLARIVVDAELWWRGGIRSAAIAEYRYYVSPGYVIFALGMGRVAEALGVHTGYLLNGVNAVAAVAFPPVVYLMARRLLDRPAAFLGCLVLPFMPTVSWGGAYGFPSLLAMLALVLATLLYDRHLTGERWLGPRADLSVVLALLVATAILKADMYLAAGAFPALYVLRRGWDTRRLLALCALLLVAPAVTAALAKVLPSGSTDAASYFVAYQKQYELQWWRAYNRPYVEGWMMAFGLFSVPLAMVGGLRLVAQRRFWLLLALFLWAATPFLFWYFRIGDSVRHHLPEAIPVALCVGLAVTLVTSRRWVWGSAIVLLVAANYLRYPASGDPFRPSGRVVGSIEIHLGLVERLQHFGDRYAAIDHPHKAILGTIGNPYADAAVMLGARSVTFAARTIEPGGLDQIEYRYMRADGKPAVHTSVRVNAEKAPAAAALYAAQGYAVYSFEHDLARGKGRDLASPKALQPYQGPAGK